MPKRSEGKRRAKASLWKSFGYAFEGLRVAAKEERNFRIHLVATLLAILLGCLLRLALWEWVALVLVIVLVLSLELVNSALEALADHVSPQYAPLIKRCKDLAAGAVLVAALGSLILACLLFLPKLLG